MGLPLGDKYKGITKWDKVIDKFILYLAGWNKRILNRAGKITLIKSVLSSLPTYYMSLFEMPVSVAKRLEKLMRDFLWDDKGKKKMHLVKWSVLYKRKKYGGLGIKSLKKMNQALLSKWLWRFAKEDDVLWRNLIAEKYRIDGVEWLSKTPNGSFGRAVWKGVMKCKHIFFKNIKFKVNRGIR